MRKITIHPVFGGTAARTGLSLAVARAMLALAFAAAWFALPAICPAAVINVDLNGVRDNGASYLTYVGTAVAPDTGTLWNGVTGNISGTTSTGLLDSQGNSSPVTVTWGGSLTGWSTAFVPSLATDLLIDYYFTYPSAGYGTFAISNLASGQMYDLYLYATEGSYTGGTAIFTIGGDVKIADNSLGGTGSVFAEGTNYVAYHGLFAMGGTISGTFAALSESEGAAFNGFQLVEVPEPATMSLLVLGGIGVLLRRRRHSGGVA